MPELDITLAGDTAADLLFYGLPRELPVERELLVDRMELAVGGSAAITAHNLAALGARVGFITPKGNDLFAAMCHQQLAEAGVDLSHIVSSLEPTGMTVLLQHDAVRRALTYPGNALKLRFADLDLDYLCSARHFHLSSYFVQRDLRDDVPRLFAAIKQAGLTISLDTNDDPWNEWPSLGESLRYVDILMPNEREACLLTGLADPQAAIDELRRVVPILVVKRAAKGASVYSGSYQDTHTPTDETFVDAVGAGDSFNAGFLSAFVKHKPLADCLRTGNAAGSFSTTQPGGIAAFRDKAAVHRRFGS